MARDRLKKHVFAAIKHTFAVVSFDAVTNMVVS